MVSKAGRTARQAAFQEKADNRRIRVHRRTDRVRLRAASEEVPADPAAGTDLHAAANNIPICRPHQMDVLQIYVSQYSLERDFIPRTEGGTQNILFARVRAMSQIIPEAQSRDPQRKRNIAVGRRGR